MPRSGEAGSSGRGEAGGAGIGGEPAAPESHLAEQGGGRFPICGRLLGARGLEGEILLGALCSRRTRGDFVRTWIFGSGLLLVVLGLSIFGWKVLKLDVPLLPDEPEGLWQVGLRVSAVPEAPAYSLQAAMPSPNLQQFVFGEQFSSGRLRLGVRDEETGRRAVWRGSGTSPFAIDLVYRVQLTRRDLQVPLRELDQEIPARIAKAYGASASDLPATSEAVTRVLEELGLPDERDVGGRIRSIFAFVEHETRSGRSDDPILVLRDREGSRLGRERLLATMLRAAGIPTRLARGLELREPNPEQRVWCQVWVGDWVPISATNRFLGNPPDNFLTLATNDAPLVSGSSLGSVDYEFEAIRERLSPQEVATMMMPSDDLFSAISLHRLPVGLQSALRILLLMPLGALVLTLLRNVVGFPSYGTFMPMLVALALRGTGLAIGLLLVGVVLLIGVFGRLFVTKLRLLLVPRLSLLLCIVVGSVTGLALLGFEFDERNFYAGLIFPIVILTMLIERFSITLAEEGLRSAAIRGGSSIALAVALYPLFTNPTIEHFMFSFPEWILVVMGILIWLGGYTGYRITDVLRFRRAVAP